MSKYHSNITSNRKWRDTARTKEYTTSKTLGVLQKKNGGGEGQSLWALLQALGYLIDWENGFKVLDVF